jgi:hypothetical protein
VDDQLKEKQIGIDSCGDGAGLSNEHYQFGGAVVGSIGSFRVFVAIHSIVGGRKPISFGKTLGRTNPAKNDSGCES